MSKDVKELLKEATKDLLTPETLTAIEEAIKVKATELANLQVEAALVAQDEKHATMLESLMNRMDADYTVKLQKLVTKLDESYAAKLGNVKTFFESKISVLNEQLNEEAKRYVGDLGVKIDTFLESQLDAILPVAKINEAVENVKAVRILESIRQMVGLNEASVSSEVKAAIIDGKKQIDEGKQAVTESKVELDKVINENAELKAQLAQKGVEVLLEQKCSKLPSKKRDHVKRVLASKDAKFINENFDYVADMFDRQELVEAGKAKKEVKTVATEVDAPVVINESKTTVNPEHAPFMSDYMASLKR